MFTDISSAARSEVQIFKVALDNLKHLEMISTTTFDSECLNAATSSQKTLVSQSTRKCCIGGTKFESAFIQELFHTFTQMGVYLDELGAFEESLKFFQYALNLCGKNDGLEVMYKFYSLHMCLSNTAFF